MKSELQAKGRQLTFLQLFPMLHFNGIRSSVISQIFFTFLLVGMYASDVPGTKAGNKTVCGFSVPIM